MTDHVSEGDAGDVGLIDGDVRDHSHRFGRTNGHGHTHPRLGEGYPGKQHGGVFVHAE
jgi:hypothetical protein